MAFCSAWHFDTSLAYESKRALSFQKAVFDVLTPSKPEKQQELPALKAIVSHSRDLLQNVLQTRKIRGIEVEVIPETPEGDISIPDLERLVVEGDRLPALIAVTHIPTNAGAVLFFLEGTDVSRHWDCF